MLPHFHISNIQSPRKPVRISAPSYDETVSSEPRATLKYEDEDGDSITIGSSLELEQCLDNRPSSAQRNQLLKLRRGPIALTEAERLHVFSIDSDETIQDVWRSIRKSSKSHMAATIQDSGNVAQPPDKPSKPRNPEVPLCAVEGSKDQNSSRGSKLEGYRTHHFNSTNPTELGPSQTSLEPRSGTNVKARTCEDGDVPPSHRQVDVLSSDPATTQRQEHGRNFLAANLTLEGKRQAQLAGEKFRARGLNHRPRKMSTGSADRQSYYNRWALYNPSEKPGILRSVPNHDAKRQAQTAGDRLRSKSTRVHHVVTAAPSNGAIVDQSCDRISKDRHPLGATRSKETSHAHPNSQMTLLELFESELVKKPQYFASPAAQSPLDMHKVPSASLMPTLDSPVRSAALGDPSSQNSSKAIENGIRNAVSGFELCLRGLVDTLKTTQPSKSEKEVLADSLHFFQNLVSKDLSSGEPPQRRRDQSPVHEVKTRNERSGENIEVEASQSLIQTDPFPAQIGDVGEVQESAQKHGDPAFLQQLPRKTAHDHWQRRPQSFESRKPDHSMDLTGPFHYHQPGPIHLPQHDIWMHKPTDMREAVPKGIEVVEDQDRLRFPGTGSDSAIRQVQQHRDPFQGSHGERSYSPIDVTARFPTIGQFETSATFATPTPPFFPPLIDFNAEEENGASQLAKSADRDTEPKKATDDPGRIPALSIPKNDAQFRAGSGPVMHENLENRLQAENQLVRGTEAATNPRNLEVFRAPRRPYSDCFSRAGQFAWDPVNDQQYQGDVNRSLDVHASSTSLPLSTLRTAPPQLSGKDPITNSGVRRSATTVESRLGRRTEHKPHRSISSSVRLQDAKIRECVDNLLGLGFDMERSRLRVYASVADGDLNKAIDIITEDQKVHDGRES